jgi:phage shock protein PspC (stress-responsive transcriptional regulator)
MSVAEELERLHALLDKGALSDDEFARAKARVLSSNGDTHSAAASQALNQLRRSRSDRLFGGVCGGLGRYTDTPSWVWRVLFCLAVICLGFGVLLYCLLWLFVPEQKS